MILEQSVQQRSLMVSGLTASGGELPVLPPETSVIPCASFNVTIQLQVRENIFTIC